MLSDRDDDSSLCSDGDDDESKSEEAKKDKTVKLLRAKNNAGAT
jgi:hypothetical protein